MVVAGFAITGSNFTQKGKPGGGGEFNKSPAKKIKVEVMDYAKSKE